MTKSVVEISDDNTPQSQHTWFDWGSLQLNSMNQIDQHDLCITTEKCGDPPPTPMSKSAVSEYTGTMSSEGGQTVSITLHHAVGAQVCDVEEPVA